MFRKIFTPNSIPIIFVVFGLFSLMLGIWGDFEQLWKETWSSLGKTVLASGVFAGILKLMQVSGVFKEELEKLIFEPKFLNNRKDISSYWDKISQELFKNKFPNISNKILKDIKDLYLPTTETIYYDKPEHFIDIQLQENGDVIVKQHTSLTLVCTGDKDSVCYEFSNTMGYTETKEQVSFTSNFIKINGKKLDEKEYTHECIDKTDIENTISNKFSVKLEGNTKYEIEREEVRRFPILLDDIIYFRAAKLTHTLSVNINHSNNLKVDFYKMGELDNFAIKKISSNFQKHEYKGIIYKEQGYILHLKNLPIR